MWASSTGCTSGLGGVAGADVGSVTVTLFPLPFLGCFGGIIKSNAWKGKGMHEGCKRRGRMGQLACTKTGLGARQLKSWRAKLARQL